MSVCPGSRVYKCSLTALKYRGKGVNLGTLFYFWVKTTFFWKIPKFFTFVNNYYMFTKWEETKQSLISIISVWNEKIYKKL